MQPVLEITQAELNQVMAKAVIKFDLTDLGCK